MHCRTLTVLFLLSIAFTTTSGADSLEDSYNAGDRCLKDGNIAEAVVHFSRVLEDKSEDAKAYRLAALQLRGTAWLRGGFFNQAYWDFFEGAAEAPNDFLWKCRIANVHFEKSDYAKAVGSCNEAIRTNPKAIWAYRLRGMSLYWQRKWREAIADFDMILRLDPNDAKALHWLAAILATHSDPKIRDPKRAITLATKSVELDETDPQALENLAAACAAAGKTIDAVTWQSNLIAVYGESAPESVKERLELYRAGKSYINPYTEEFSKPYDSLLRWPKRVVLFNAEE